MSNSKRYTNGQKRKMLSISGIREMQTRTTTTYHNTTVIRKAKFKRLKLLNVGKALEPSGTLNALLGGM